MPPRKRRGLNTIDIVESPLGRCAMLTLPPELLEEILVNIAESDKPTAIATLAQCCRALRRLVYDPVDKFLWRRIFLTTFDDPRIALPGRFESFDWGRAYRSRIHAQLVLKSKGKATTKSLPSEVTRSLRRRPREAKHSYTVVLRTLLDVIDTSLPVYPATSATNEPDSSARGQLLRDLPNIPLSQVAARAQQYPPKLPPVSHSDVAYTPSKNIPWLSHTVTDMILLEDLMDRYTTAHPHDPWARGGEGRAFLRLVACIGAEMLPFDNGRVKKHTPSVRYESSKRVYNMRYPVRSRAWGPFMPVGFKPDEEETSVTGVGMDAEEENGAIEQGDEDALIKEDSDSSYKGGSSDEDEGEEDDEEPDDSQLYPDWEHLAAIRVVVQDRVQKAVAQDLDVDLIRRGVWRGSLPTKSNDERKRIDGEVDGWDWAGVEGVWQRAVTWLGYENLLNQNRTKFAHLDVFEEAYTMVPLTLRIVKYTPCLVPGYEDRPTIHVQGWMGGEMWEGGMDQRKIEGTVSVIADGSIRWKMLSSTEDPVEWEWCSEGVQVGSGDGARSGCGVLGLWTGWRHEEGDPIGAWWQWRVA